MPLTEKVRETRLRRVLWRRGYRLAKSRTRDPDALTYRGYHITDHTGQIVAGQGNLNRGYALNLDEVEAWLQNPEENSSYVHPQTTPRHLQTPRTRSRRADPR